MPRLLFTNIGTDDVPAAQRFFAALGFSFNDKFSDESTICMEVNEQAYVMIMENARFAEFATKPVADAAATTEALLTVSADSREEVDELVDTALANGGSPAKEPLDFGFMYGRSFQDLDGHHWEVMWMDPRAVEQGPEAFAAEHGAG